MSSPDKSKGKKYSIVKSSKNNLASSLSNNRKKEIIRTYSSGSVLKFTHPDYEDQGRKFFVFLYEEDSILYFMKIYSKIDNYNRVNDYVTISPKDNKFLKPGGFSFIKCFDIKYVSIDALLPQFDSLFKGEISNQTGSDILKVVKRLNDMTEEMGEKIIKALESINKKDDKMSFKKI